MPQCCLWYANRGTYQHFSGVIRNWANVAGFSDISVIHILSCQLPSGSPEEDPLSPFVEKADTRIYLLTP